MKLDLSALFRLPRSLAVRAGQATFRFPAAALAVLAIAAISNWAVWRDLAGDTVVRGLLALTAGAAAAIAATLFVESRGGGAVASRMAGFLGLALVGAAVGLAHPFLLHGPALTIAIVTLVPLSPFVGRGTSRAFWDFGLWTALGVTLGWFSVLIFLLGFTAIFEMVRTLFGVGLGSRAYSHLFTTGLTLVGPLFALGRIPHPGEAPGIDRTSDRLERAVRPLFEWVTTPLVLAASAIIHVYAAKIVLTGDVPTNEIGWIVLLFASFVLALRVGLEPYLADLPQPARFFARYWAAMLIVPLLLLAYALTLRVAGQGWTIERYFSALYGLAAALSVILQALPRTRVDVRFIVAMPPVLLLLSTFGPWGVADTVGRSQAALISRNHAGTLEKGAEAVRGLDTSANAELRSRLDAMEEVEQLDRLAPGLEAFSAGDGEARVAGLRRALDEGATLAARAAEEREQSFSADGAWDVGGFDRVLPPVSVTLDVGDDTSAIRLEAGGLAVTYRDRSDRFALGPALAGIGEAGASGILPVMVLDLRSTEGRAIRFRVLHARWSSAGELVFLQGWLALRHGEWASLP